MSLIECRFYILKEYDKVRHDKLPSKFSEIRHKIFNIEDNELIRLKYFMDYIKFIDYIYQIYFNIGKINKYNLIQSLIYLNSKNNDYTITNYLDKLINHIIMEYDEKEINKDNYEYYK